MNKKLKYTVERYENNEWEFHSRHNDKEYAIINAGVVYNSRKLEIRIWYNGEVIFNQADLLKLKENKK